MELLRQRNLVPGIKVDQGLVKLFGTDNESTTQGLDNLYQNCIQYKKDGCHFAKWRCIFSISEHSPSQLTMVTNANVLARYDLAYKIEFHTNLLYSLHSKFHQNIENCTK